MISSCNWSVAEDSFYDAWQKGFTLILILGASFYIQKSDLFTISSLPRWAQTCTTHPPSKPIHISSFASAWSVHTFHISLSSQGAVIFWDPQPWVTAGYGLINGDRHSGYACSYVHSSAFWCGWQKIMQEGKSKMIWMRMLNLLTPPAPLNLQSLPPRCRWSTNMAFQAPSCTDFFFFPPSHLFLFLHTKGLWVCSTFEMWRASRGCPGTGLC